MSQTISIEHVRDDASSGDRIRLVDSAAHARTSAFHSAADYFFRTIGYAKLRDFLYPPLRRALGGALPNQGNYCGKRTPKPEVKPLSPPERFARLAAHYLACTQTYRNPPTSRDCAESCRISRLVNTQHKRKQSHAA